MATVAFDDQDRESYDSNERSDAFEVLEDVTELEHLLREWQLPLGLDADSNPNYPTG